MRVPTTLKQYDGDWEPCEVPTNVFVDETAYIFAAECFGMVRSEREIGVQIGKASQVNDGSCFDVSATGRVMVGNYVLLTTVFFICDTEITVGDYTMISWSAAIMDTYRWPRNASDRAAEAISLPNRFERRPTAKVESKPVQIGTNVWIGFEAVVLPGVTIGNDSIIGARSVVTENVPPGVVYAGNPARFVKTLHAKDRP